MALPDELLDELLSAHLDGAASGDERARVEQMLSDDAAVRQRFASMKAQRDTFRSAAIATPKLPRDFADQVVRAAIAQAQTDQLPADHPLQLAARSTAVSRPTAASVRNAKHWAWAAGLAAAILLAGFAVQRLTQESEDPNLDHSIAGVIKPVPDTTALAMDDHPAVANNNDSESMSTAEVAATSLVDSAAVDTSLPRMPAINSPSVVAMESNPPSPIAVQPLNALFVVEVKLSAAGRSSDAFGQALKLMDIESNAERQVDVQLTRAINGNSDLTNLETPAQRVLLLEASAKQLDLLVTHLFSERSGIEGISFSMISAQFDGPLLSAIDAVRTVDVKKIRHQGHVTPIVSNSEAKFDAWAKQVGNRAFAPLSGPQDAKVLQPVDNGPDVITNILFLVR